MKNHFLEATEAQKAVCVNCGDMLYQHSKKTLKCPVGGRGAKLYFKPKEEEVKDVD